MFVFWDVGLGCGTAFPQLPSYGIFISYVEYSYSQTGKIFSNGLYSKLPWLPLQNSTFEKIKDFWRFPIAINLYLVNCISFSLKEMK